MGRKQLLLDLILHKNAEQDSDSDEDSNNSESEVDSDQSETNVALQKALASGKLKPGLHTLVEMAPKLLPVNDVQGLKNKLQEFQAFKNNWIERLDLSSEPAKPSAELIQKHGDLELKINRNGQISGENGAEEKAQNDFKREMLFYRQAQTTVIEGLRKLKTSYGITQTRRPDDYFAEMIKTDQHMQIVRERLQAKQNSIEESEKAKKLREAKKYGKKVQQEVQLKRQQEKKQLLQKIQNFKKGKEDSLDFLDGDNDGDKKQQTPGKKNQQPQKKATKKQKYKSDRYGYGGQKKRSKYNSAESAANMSAFSARKHGRPVGKKKLAAKPNRPGKARRQKARS